MKLSAPKQIVFLISLVIAIIGVLMALGVLAMIPVASVGCRRCLYRSGRGLPA